MDFVFHSKASGCFLPMNYTVTIGWLYCLDLAWFFSRLVIHSSSFVFTFFTTASSLLNFLFVECSWDVVSFSFNIWLQRLDMSGFTIILQLLVSPIIHLGKWNIKIEFLRFWIHVFPLHLLGKTGEEHQSSVVGKIREKNRKIFAISGRVAVHTFTYTYIIYS